MNWNFFDMILKIITLAAAALVGAVLSFVIPIENRLIANTVGLCCFLLAAVLVFSQNPSGSASFNPSLPFGNRAGQAFLFLIFFIGILFAIAEMREFERENDSDRVVDPMPNQ